MESDDSDAEPTSPSLLRLRGSSPEPMSPSILRFRERQAGAKQTTKRPRTLRIEELWGVKPTRQRVEIMPAERMDPEPDEDQLLLVDLFCGCGGFSCGAQGAGAKVVLAVDCDRAALAYHKANHRGCTHVNMTLGPETEERLVELIRSAVPSGRKWHLHGSPPCQLFSSMRNLTKGKQPINGMQLVKWYVNFVERIAPDSWTFENVRAPQIKSFMTEKGITHGYFNFVDYGVPQTRKRCLAGTHDIIHAFRTDRSLLVATPQSPLNVLTPPSQAVYIRASGGKCTDYFYRTVSEPTWSLLCACKPVYAAHDQSCIRVMHIREMLRIQTFPDSYRMKSSGHLGMLGSESDRVRLVGNAVPPLIAAMLVEIATRL